MKKVIVLKGWVPLERSNLDFLARRIEDGCKIVNLLRRFREAGMEFPVERTIKITVEVD